MAQIKKKYQNGDNREQSGKKLNSGCGLWDLLKGKKGKKKGSAKNEINTALSRQIEVQARNSDEENPQVADESPKIVPTVTSETQQQQELRNKRASRRDTPFIFADTTIPLYEGDFAGAGERFSQEADVSMEEQKAEQQLENNEAGGTEGEGDAPPVPARSPSRPKPYLKSNNGHVRRLASSIQNLADVARSDTDPNTIRKASRAVSEAAEVRDMEDLFGDIYENVREEDITEVLAGVAK